MKRVEIGDRAPDFTMPSHTGEQVSLADFRGKKAVVLFFYPAAFTRGCTAEVCHFRDVVAEFRALGAQPVGISADSVQKQADFADAYSLGYPLLSDPDGKVRGLFDIGRGLVSGTRRTTFVIDTDSRVLDIIRNEFLMNVHADRALATLRAK